MGTRPRPGQTGHGGRPGSGRSGGRSNYALPSVPIAYDRIGGSRSRRDQFRCMFKSSTGARPPSLALSTRRRGRCPEGATQTVRPGSGQVEAIEVHDLVPRGHEVLHELLLRVFTSVYLGDSSKLGVRTEHEVDGGTGPLDLAGVAVAPLVYVLGGGHAPLRAHLEQVHEEVVGQCLGPVSYTH